MKYTSSFFFTLLDEAIFFSLYFTVTEENYFYFYKIKIKKKVILKLKTSLH